MNDIESKLLEKDALIAEQSIMIEVLRNRLESREAELEVVHQLLKDMESAVIYAINHKLENERRHIEENKPSKFELIGDSELVMSSYLVSEFMIKTMEFTKREMETLVDALEKDDFREIYKVIDEREQLRKELLKFSSKGSVDENGR